MGRHRWSHARTHVANASVFQPLRSTQRSGTLAFSALWIENTVRSHLSWKASTYVRARTVSAVFRKTCSASSEALWGARWARGSSKGSCEAQSTSLSRSLASRKAISSGCEGWCLIHYILACEALFSATDGAMRACLWPMRPWFRARVR